MHEQYCWGRVDDTPHRLSRVDPDTIAIVDSRDTVTHGHLRSFAVKLREARISAGVRGASTIVGAVTDDLLTAALLSQAPNIAPFAPLDPTLRRGQLEQRYEALRAGIVVVDDPEGFPAAVAADMGLGVIVAQRSNSAPWAESPLGIRDRCRSEPSGHVEQPAMILHTSGTSGAPSMVPISHRNLDASIQAMASTFGLTDKDRSLVVLPLFHVHSIMSSVVVPLAVGASVACPGLYNATEFLGWLQTFAPTYYSAVPTVHTSVLRRTVTHPAELGEHRLRFIRSSSATLSPEIRNGLEGTFGVPVSEGYAMTEAVSQITTNPLPPGRRKDFSVGTSVGPEIMITTEDGTEAEPGQPGRVRIRGASVVSGYLTDPDRSAQRFGKGWFDTGDSGYVDPDGYLFLTGRSSDRIKRGGASISPAGVEACLLEHPAVHEATVFAVPDQRLGEQVAAVVVTDSGADEQMLRDHVFEHRTPIDVPRRILIVDQLPTGATGKPLRSGLADLFGLHDMDAPAEDHEPRMPTTDLERALCVLWAEVLNTSVSDVNANFFSLGGDSLRIKELIVRVAEEVSVEVPFISFFDALTVAAQVDVISEAPAITEGHPTSTPAHAVDPLAPFPLSRAQERLWVLEQLDPGRPDYHIPWRARCSGRLDLDRLERALQAVANRHQPLQTIISNNSGHPMQQVREMRVPFERRIWGTDAHERIAEHTEAPFDLANDPMIRALALSAGDDHLLSIVVHHLAADGRSLENLANDLSEAYETDLPLPLLPAQYSDFVQWEASRAASMGYQDDLQRWRTTFTPQPAQPTLPGGRTPDGPPGGPAHTVTLDLGAVTPTALRDITRQAQATPFMVLLASVVRAISKAQKTTDVVIGTPSEDRMWAPAAPMIGYFVNTLPLRVDTTGEPTGLELIRRVKSRALQAYAAAAVSFDDIVATVNPVRDPNRTPLFDTMFTASHGEPALPTLTGLDIAAVSRETDLVKFPIEIDMRIGAEHITGSISCDQRWIDHSTATALAALIEASAEAMVRTPERSVI